MAFVNIGHRKSPLRSGGGKGGVSLSSPHSPREGARGWVSHFMQLVVPSAVRNAVSAATITFTASSITRCFFIFVDSF